MLRRRSLRCQNSFTCYCATSVCELSELRAMFFIVFPSTSVSQWTHLISISLQSVTSEIDEINICSQPSQPPCQSQDFAIISTWPLVQVSPMLQQWHGPQVVTRIKRLPRLLVWVSDDNQSNGLQFVLSLRCSDITPACLRDLFCFSSN